MPLATTVALLVPAVGEAAGIDLGKGVEPPGGAKLVQLMDYVMWAVSGLCVVGVLLAAGAMAVSHHRGGGGGEHASRLGLVLVACVVAGCATSLVGALT